MYIIHWKQLSLWWWWWWLSAFVGHLFSVSCLVFGFRSITLTMCCLHFAINKISTVFRMSTFNKHYPRPKTIVPLFLLMFSSESARKGVNQRHRMTFFLIVNFFELKLIMNIKLMLSNTWMSITHAREIPYFGFIWIEWHEVSGNLMHRRW